MKSGNVQSFEAIASFNKTLMVATPIDLGQTASRSF